MKKGFKLLVMTLCMVFWCSGVALAEEESAFDRFKMAVATASNEARERGDKLITVQLSENVPFEYAYRYTFQEGETFILDLNGFEIYPSDEYIANSASALFDMVGRNAKICKFIIKDSTNSKLSGMDGKNQPYMVLVKVSDGDLEIQGGTFQNSRTAFSLDNSNVKMTGGIVQNNGGGFTLLGTGNYDAPHYQAVFSGGTIQNNQFATNNTATDSSLGGGIMAGTFQDVVIDGARITNNKAGNGGGISCVNLVMKKGEISFNEARNGKGGGINATSVELLGGIIKNNKAKEDGGGIFTHSIKLTGGEIYKNTSGKNGGGIYIFPGKESSISGGKITENVATKDGGGIYGHVTLKISGGEITGNTAGQSGGGVSAGLTTVWISGGKITGNKAQKSSGVEASFKVSGNPYIYGNDKSNVDITYQTIELAGELKGAKIGVTTTEFGCDGTTTFLSNPKNLKITNDVMACFIPDNDGVYIGKSEYGSVILTKNKSQAADPNATTLKPLAKGKTFKASNMLFTVTNSTPGKAEVAFTKRYADGKKVTIPNTVKKANVVYKVTSIKKNAMKNDRKVTQITIPANVKEIGNAAFYGCKKLTKITSKAKNLKKVGNAAIKNADKKLTITAPNKYAKNYRSLFTSKTGFVRTMKVK